MNHRIRLLLFFLLSSLASRAQVDYNKIILPDEVSDSVEFRERLVQIAWRNNPGNNILHREVQIAATEIEKARINWLNNIRLAGNLNEYSADRLISGQDAEDAIGNRFFPIYNFGVTLPLGVFFENPRNTKIARENYGIAQDQVNARKLELRAAVLTLYQDYLMQKELLEVQTSITEGRYAQFQLAKQQFEDGSVAIETFEEIRLQYNLQRMNSIRGERDFLNAKLRLEELLGVRLEDI